MDKIEKYKCNCICCCKPFKDKYRLMKTGRLMVVGEAFVTATQLSIAGKYSLCHVYMLPYGVQKATENVDARTRTLQDKVSSAHPFFQAHNECEAVMLQS